MRSGVEMKTFVLIITSKNSLHALKLHILVTKWSLKLLLNIFRTFFISVPEYID